MSVCMSVCVCRCATHDADAYTVSAACCWEVHYAMSQWNLSVVVVCRHTWTGRLTDTALAQRLLYIQCHIPWCLCGMDI